MSIANLMISEQPLWTGAISCYPYSERLAMKMTVRSRFGDEYVLHRVAGDKIFLPRAICPIADEDLRVKGVPVKVNAIKFEARNAEQTRFINEASALLAQGQSFIAEAPTGMGKTACSCPIIASVGRLTMVVVPKMDLITRWREDLQAILGLKAHEIGLVQQDTVAVSGKKVVLASLQSLCKDGRYPAAMKQEIGFMIFDEVHRLGAEEFMKVAGMFPALVRMGLSATPKRQDGKETAFQAHIGPVRVRVTIPTLVPRVLAVKTAWRCPRWGNGKKADHAPGKDMHVKRYLTRDKTRNAMLTKIVYQCYQKDRNIVVFSEMVEHLQTLQTALEGIGVLQSDIGMYHGTMSPAQEAAAKVKRVMLATYGKMSEGTDVPRLDTCVFATPRSHVVQIAGRITREFVGKEDPLIIDLIDEDSDVFKGYAKTRADWYARLGAKVETVTWRGG